MIEGLLNGSTAAVAAGHTSQEVCGDGARPSWHRLVKLLVHTDGQRPSQQLLSSFAAINGSIHSRSFDGGLVRIRTVRLLYID